MKTIAIAGWQHETNTFSPIATTYNDFLQADSWPKLLTGDEILALDRETNIPIAGFMSAAETEFQLLPLLWCSATPSGTVENAAADKIQTDLLEGIKKNKHIIDALYLDLHGAMVSENFADFEGVLLKAIRKIIGNKIPIVCSLDLHANISEDMVTYSDGLLAYCTYPHIDTHDTGRKAAAFLRQLLVDHITFHKAFKKVPFLISMTAQCTDNEPAKSLYLNAVHAKDQFVSIAMGFPLSDSVHTGPSIVCYATDKATAEETCANIYNNFIQQQKNFALDILPAKTAVKKAAQAKAYPVIIADTQDNPGCGGSGDTTGILIELIKQKVDSALIVLMAEPEIAATAHKAGLKQTINITFADRHNSKPQPIQLDCKIIALGYGNMIGTGPYYKNCHFELGPMALLQHHGVKIIVASKKMQAADQALIRHVGLDPNEEKIIDLKSSVHFRADFSKLAAQILIAKAPGLNIADPYELDYQYYC